MPTLTYQGISDVALYEIVGNTATDAPVGATEILVAINQAYALVWEISGGAIVAATSATLWTVPATPTGVVTGILSGIRDITHLFATTGASSVAYTDSTTSELDRVEQGRIIALRKSSLTGGYDRPKLYSITRLQPASPGAAGVTAVGLLQLDYWPHTATKYEFPALYLPEFTPLDGGTSDCPNVNDLESYDIAYLAASYLAPRIGREHLVDDIMAKVSDATAAALGRKRKTLLSGDQDA